MCFSSYHTLVRCGSECSIKPNKKLDFVLIYFQIGAARSKKIQTDLAESGASAERLRLKEENAGHNRTGRGKSQR